MFGVFKAAVLAAVLAKMADAQTQCITDVTSALPILVAVGSDGSAVCSAELNGLLTNNVLPAIGGGYDVAALLPTFFADNIVTICGCVAVAGDSVLDAFFPDASAPCECGMPCAIFLPIPTDAVVSPPFPPF